MAGPVEHRRIESTHLGKPVEREVPGQCVRPFVAEHLDGLRLTKIAVELDYEPLIPPKALAQDRFGQPGGPNDDREGWRAFPSKTRQNRLKLAPARAVYEGVGRRGEQTAGPHQGSAVAAEDARGITTTGNHVCSVAPTKPARYLGAYGHAATTTRQYRSQYPEGC